MKARAKNRPAKQPHSDLERVVRRHLRWGWYSLLGFLTLGLVLEALHGLKAPFYLNVSNETRRLMWTLAHAHGTLLGLIHLAFAQTVHQLPAWPGPRRQLASLCLAAATLLMPSGFFLGGCFLRAGEPGLPIALVPAGGVLLMLAVFQTARSPAASVSADPRSTSPGVPAAQRR